MITRNFNLYLNAGHSVPLVINVNQYDSGEQWVFTLYNADGTQYTPSTGAIVGIKSDGLGIINSGSVVDGKVVINETEQMTAAVGKATFELLIDSQTHGTANFVVLVEEKPGNNADLSESDLSLLQEAIDATSPLPTGGSVGQVLTKTANGSAWSDAGTPTQAQVAEAVSDWADENITVETGVVIDTSLSVAGAAADAKKTGDEVACLKSAISTLSSIPTNVKLAMDALFAKAAYADADIADYYTTFHAWATTVSLLSISAVYTQSDDVYLNTSLDDLKQDLVVTAYYDNGTSAEVTAYSLSGELTVGTSIITVTLNNKTATFNVTVENANDITPRLSDFVAEANTTVTVDGDSIITKTSVARMYVGAAAPINVIAGLTYKLSFDATVISGTGLGAFINANTLKTLDYIGPFTEADHYEAVGVLSEHHNYVAADGTKVKLYANWSPSANGEVRYSNIKVIEYLSEGE